MSDRNKRKSERLKMFRVCRYNIEGRDYADLSTNISDRGIFIKNFSPPPIGTVVSLTVKLTDEWGNLPLRIIGRVAHVNSDPDPHKRGMGIEFTSVISNSVPMIEYFVREIYDQDKLNKENLQKTEDSPAQGTSSFEYHILKKDEK
ncbi:MAG: PilZ domain-containing protein [Deltaproteobacteria bacterium]|nr:PilZ domain-containing protein [Deltaproteobacteria bacterium]